MVIVRGFACLNSGTILNNAEIYFNLKSPEFAIVDEQSKGAGRLSYYRIVSF